MTPNKQVNSEGVSTRNASPAPHEQVLATVLGFWRARALALARELGVRDLLAEGPLHVDDLANGTGKDVSVLFRLLRALESVGIFNEGFNRHNHPGFGEGARA
jgi:hypothetical protein